MKFFVRSEIRAYLIFLGILLSLVALVAFLIIQLSKPPIESGRLPQGNPFIQGNSLGKVDPGNFRELQVLPEPGENESYQFQFSRTPRRKWSEADLKKFEIDPDNYFKDFEKRTLEELQQYSQGKK